ncbi:hypothetical protein HGRIS_001326 [Hohenbuehelia grisea]|uniref:Uncharacterized protein n=1 Tax=Hohenbuehelia grisea TaxID=104357 RepID=A0ABR3JP69_9AGAR
MKLGRKMISSRTPRLGPGFGTTSEEVLTGFSRQTPLMITLGTGEQVFSAIIFIMA